MIIKIIKPHANAGQLGRYLLRDSKGNERMEDRGARGTVSDDTVGALQEMAASRRGARCQQPLYHCVFNAAKGEHLTPDQWERALGMWEKEMGLSDRQRVVVQHFKDDRWHTHAVWNRIDPLTGKAVNVGRDHFKAKKVAREIEREFDLQKVPDRRVKRQREQQPALEWEANQTRRTKTDEKQTRAEIAEAWTHSDTGTAFQHALEDQNLTLARGDQRPFVVVDPAGSFFALSGRLLPDAKMKDIRAKLADIDYDSLPTLEEARAKNEKLKSTQSSKAVGVGAAPGNAVAEQTPNVGSAIHDHYRRVHLELNEESKTKEHAFSESNAKLQAAQQRERQHLEEKQRDKWWQKVIRKSERVRQKEAKQRDEQQKQQARERAALKEREEKELKAVEARRAELRKQEKQDRAIQREFDRQARLQDKADGPSQPFTKLKQARNPGERHRTAEEETERQRKREELRRIAKEKELERKRQRDRGRSFSDD